MHSVVAGVGECHAHRFFSLSVAAKRWSSLFFDTETSVGAFYDTQRNGLKGPGDDWYLGNWLVGPS